MRGSFSKFMAIVLTLRNIIMIMMIIVIMALVTEDDTWQ